MGILSFFKRRKPADDHPERDRRPEHPATPEAPARPAGGEDRGVPLGDRTIVRPTVTEKSSLLGSRGQYTFHVDGGATKQDVRRAVERKFSVHVERVRMMNVPSKLRRRGRIVGRVPGYRKAIVHLAEGEHLDLSTPGK